jgi:hypothetical protein
MWRPRTTRSIPEPRPSRRTLDRKHQENVASIEDSEANVAQWQASLDKLKNQPPSLVNTGRIYELERNIQQTSKARQEYFLDNSHDLFEYFEDRQRESTDNSEVGGSAKIDAFFFGRRHGAVKTDGAAERYRASTEVEDLMGDMQVACDFQCVCGGEMVAIEAEGMRTCRRCGLSKPFMSESDRLTYKEPPKEVTFYSYQRINHFREILAQFQGKESTHIADTVYARIRTQMKKERKKPHELNVIERKELLKKLGFSGCYEHMAFIWNQLGVSPPIVPPALEQQLSSLFCNVEKRYAVHCPDDRVNFLHYYYVLYKLFEMLGERQYLSQIVMLKDPARTAEQDVVWQKICGDFGWPFIPTL